MMCFRIGPVLRNTPVHLHWYKYIVMGCTFKGARNGKNALHDGPRAAGSAPQDGSAWHRGLPSQCILQELHAH